MEDARDAGSSKVGENVGTSTGQVLVSPGPRNESRMHRTHSAQVLGYVPAVAHFGKSTYVDCYATHPDTGQLKRKRYKLDRIQEPTLRKRMARDLVQKLNRQMAMGWNPWSTDTAPRAMHRVREVLDEFVRYKERMTRNTSPANYRSAARRFGEFATLHGLIDGPLGNVTAHHAIKYMEWLMHGRDLRNNTYNVYLQFVKGMFFWMKDRGYISHNPFLNVRRLRKVTKVKQLLTLEERRQAIAWFQEHDPRMVLVCMFVFHTLVRPRAELRRLRVGWVDLENQVLHFNDGGDTKSGTSRHPAIPNSMAEALRAANITSANGNWFVVSEDLKPGPAQVPVNEVGLRWVRMRKALGWPAGKQLASLRDSGIVQLIRDGVKLEVVMRHADHKNIATTNAYVQHAFPYAQREVIEKATPMV